MRVKLAAFAVSLAAASALGVAAEPIAGYDDAPDSLSAWHLFERRGQRLVLNRGVVPYDLNTPLFSDYAHKWRTISVPSGTAIRYDTDGAFLFPVGTIISKTFYYPLADRAARHVVAKSSERSAGEVLDIGRVRLIETRLLINTQSGWLALPYVWNERQTDAALELTGELVSLELSDAGAREPFTYSVPDANQCSACHGRGEQAIAIEPIGVKSAHLDKAFTYARGAENQLAHWRKAGLIRGTPAHAPGTTAKFDDTNADLNARARAYLEVNCGHCHREDGGASTSGLLLDAQEQDSIKLGVCKIPVATGRGSGTGSFDIVPGNPEDSILLQRMQSNEPDIAMPEIGRAVVHREGVALIAAWIRSLPGTCE